MRTFIWTALTVFLAASGVNAETEGHIFTDTKGRSVVATIVRFDEAHNKVTLKPEGRGAVTVPATAFSKSDQTYIVEWSKNQALLDERKFSIDFTRMKESDSGGRHEGYDMSTKAYENYFKIELSNRSDVELKDITVEYVVFYTQDAWTKETRKSNRRVSETINGTQYSKRTITMAAKSDQTIETDRLSLKTYRESDFNESYTWDDLDSEMEGIMVKVSVSTKSGDPITRQFCYPDKLEKGWTTKTKDATLSDSDVW